MSPFISASPTWERWTPIDMCRMLLDTEYFKSRISKIDGAGDIGDYLVNIVNAKDVAERPKPAEASTTEAEEPAEKVQGPDDEDKT